MHRIALTLAVLIGLAMACGGGDEGSGGSSSGVDPANPAAESKGPSIEERSADAKACIDLVEQKRYADAIPPCEKALKDTAATGMDDVEAALAEAKAAVEKEATKAAAAMAADAATGEMDEESAKKQGLDAVNNLRGGGN
jgi:hypothetical protein